MKQITNILKKEVMRIMETTKKNVTKRDYFAMVKAIVEQTDVDNKAEIVAFIDHEVELLNKKSTKKSSSKYDEAILATIKEVLAEQDKPVTITELMDDTRLQSYLEMEKGVEVTKKMTNQKLSAMTNKLVDTKEVVKTIEKKKSFFSLNTVSE
jgi:hypothetical protein